MQLDKNHLKQIVINVFDRNIIKTKQHVFACSAFVWSLVSEIWYAHFWYGFIRFCTHCPYQIHVIIYLAYTTKLLNNYLYLHAYKLLHHVFLSFFEIYSLSVCKTQNKSNYAWFSNISVKLDIVPAPHHAPFFVLPDYEIQWGDTIYEEVFLFPCYI